MISEEAQRKYQEALDLFLKKPSMNKLNNLAKEMVFGNWNEIKTRHSHPACIRNGIGDVLCTAICPLNRLRLDRGGDLWLCTVMANNEYYWKSNDMQATAKKRLIEIVVAFTILRELTSGE